MKSKLLLAVGALALGSLSAANATTFEFVFGAPMTVGSTVLSPGTYYIGAKRDCAIFQNVDTGRTFKAYGRVVHLNHKNRATMVVTNHQNRIERVAVYRHATEIQFPQ